MDNKTGLIRNIYGFFDDDLGITEIFTVANDAYAVRTFTELCNNKQTPLGKYYEKVKLVKLAKFNDRTGKVSVEKEEFEEIITGKQVVIPNDNSSDGK